METYCGCWRSAGCFSAEESEDEIIAAALPLAFHVDFLISAHTLLHILMVSRGCFEVLNGRCASKID